MKPMRLTALAVAAAALAACDSGPTNPDALDAAFDEVDPVVVTFAATQGLPGGPFGGRDHPPFLGGMAYAGAPVGPAHGRGPGAALPDSLKLTAAQQVAIGQLVTAFVAANAADLATMRDAHAAAREARKAGATRDAIRAILDAARPAAERVKVAAEVLRTAIRAVLTDAQRAWIDAHKPDRPPRTP